MILRTISHVYTVLHCTCTACWSCLSGTSLRRVGAVVGNFFGVTEASQQGSADIIGWEEFTERRVEVSMQCEL